MRLLSGGEHCPWLASLFTVKQRVQISGRFEVSCEKVFEDRGCSIWTRHYLVT